MDFLISGDPRDRWSHESPLETISSDYLIIVEINNVCMCVQLCGYVAECVYS